MSDNDSRFIYALLSSNKSEQEKFYAQAIPQGIFTVKQREIKWVYDHRERYGAYPSLQSYQAFFRSKLPSHRETLPAVLQPILDLAMFEQMRKVQLKVKKMLDGGEPVKDALAVFKAETQRLSTYSVDYVDVHFARDNSAIERYRQRAKSRVSQQTQRILTPWQSLNGLIKYFTPGEVADVVARPSMSKTWTTLHWANHLANSGYKGIFFTKEMPTEQIQDRNEALKFRLDYELQRDGKLPMKELLRWQSEKRKLRHADNYNLVISGDETIEGTGLAHITSKIQQYRPDFVVLDGAYLIYPEGLSKNAPRTERFGFLSNRLKAIAKATKVFMIVVLQMNRLAEKAGKNGSQTKGTIADIFGSDNWCQDADWVFELSGKRGSNRREISLLKARESALGSVHIRSEISPYPCFDEMSAAMTGQVQFEGIE